MGEDALSNTCFVYPRQHRNFAGQYEQSLTLSCPEAARKALLTPDAMDFMVSPMAVRESTVVPVKQMRGLTYPLMDEIRIFCMQLTRTQGITIWQRLAILGVFCEMLARTIAEDRGHAAVNASIESFTLMVQNGQILDALTGFKPDFEEQAKLFALLMNGNPPLPSSTHTEVRDSVIAGLGADDDGKVTLAKMIECYSYGVSRLPEALEKSAPYLLENYLVNEMFRTLFPFAGGSVYDSYLQLVARYGVLRLMLAAQCGPGRELPTQEELVKTVHVFARRFQHSTQYAQKVDDFLKSSERNSLDRVFRFLAE